MRPNRDGRIHGVNCQIREKNTIAPAVDPHRTKGNRPSASRCTL
jgi:hypothetical protein